MVEMTIGSRFYCKDKLLEVVKCEGVGPLCGRCAFSTDVGNCRKTKCYGGDRHDGEHVYFKEVKE